MNEAAERTFLLRLVSERACFRRPQFSEDFVSYDVLPPLHAMRLVQALIEDADRWRLERVCVASAIEWCWDEITTPTGRRRVYALRRPAYLLQLADVSGSNDMPRVLSGARAHLGLAEYPARFDVMPLHAASDAVISEDADLGWMPIAISPRPQRTTIYQWLRLIRGVVDLRAQVDQPVAR